MMRSKALPKTLLLTSALVLAAVLPAASPAVAQNRLVPPMAGIGQIVVVEPLINDTAIANTCKVDIKEIQKYIAGYLGRENLPVIAVESSAEMVRTDVFRLTIKPEIATLKDGVVSCVSWVGLKAESQHTVRLPPLADRKTVTVSYWNRGGLVMTPIVDHAVGLQNAYTILLRNLVRQYRIDNPGENAPDAVENADTMKSRLPQPSDADTPTE